MVREQPILSVSQNSVTSIPYSMQNFLTCQILIKITYFNVIYVCINGKLALIWLNKTKFIKNLKAYTIQK